MKILLVGGNWDKDGGRPSRIVSGFSDVLKTLGHGVDVRNGGDYADLQGILDSTPGYDAVFWFANVPNDLPKVRDVKEVAPYVMLVTSKRNDGGKHPDNALVGRALASKSNLLFEFRKDDDRFRVRVIDPLACVWYEGYDMENAIATAMDRLTYLASITRQRTTQSQDTSKGLVLSWYFDQFKTPEEQSGSVIQVPDQQPFVDLIHKYAERLQEIAPLPPDAVRFLGNASMKPLPPQVGRCGKSMPSFKVDGMVFVSRRNVPKQFIELDDFVPVWLDEPSTGSPFRKIFYAGEDKPSVDSPVQIRLYEALSNIRYMVHTHAYIPGAPSTGYAIPCGAVEEVDEVLRLIDTEFKSRDLTRYALNLFGHGSIIMADTVEGLEGYRFEPRPQLEKMCHD